mgnify:CR=1 FL=1
MEVAELTQVSIWDLGRLAFSQKPLQFQPGDWGLTR